MDVFAQVVSQDASTAEKTRTKMCVGTHRGNEMYCPGVEARHLLRKRGELLLAESTEIKQHSACFVQLPQCSNRLPPPLQLCREVFIAHRRR